MGVQSSADIDADGVHLVGSVAMDSAEAVFRAVAGELGDRVRRLPDGETGDRMLFTLWQADVFARHPDFQPVRDRSMLRLVQTYELRPGADPAKVVFGDLGYAREAKESYQVFRRLREEGVIRPGVRFQVSLPSPPNTLSLLVGERDAPAVEPAYEAALLAEADEIAAAVPHEDLAIQWDVAYEVRVWDGSVPLMMTRPWFGPDPRQRIVDGLTRLGARVPEGVELGYHLCHGDYAHTGNLFFRLRGGPGSRTVRRALDAVLNRVATIVARPPRTAAAVGELATALAVASPRPIDFVHVPVPRSAGDAYFAPLAKLELQPRTQLFLGLLHMADGVAGARRRMAAAREVVAGFGVGTACGWGRRDPETLGALLKLHRDVSAPVSAVRG